jgi:hypothetical protein
MVGVGESTILQQTWYLICCARTPRIEHEGKGTCKGREAAGNPLNHVANKHRKVLHRKDLATGRTATVSRFRPIAAAMKPAIYGPLIHW